MFVHVSGYNSNSHVTSSQMASNLSWYRSASHNCKVLGSNSVQTWISFRVFFVHCRKKIYEITKGYRSKHRLTNLLTVVNLPLTTRLNVKEFRWPLDPGPELWIPDLKLTVCVEMDSRFHRNMWILDSIQ